MKLLPRWVLTHIKPGFYDSESGTAIEQTAKVYKAMNELIEEYNTFADNWNTRIEEFTSGVISDNEEFRIGLRQEFQDFINVVDLKMESLDQYTKNELNSEIHRIYRELVEGDEIQSIITKHTDTINNNVLILIQEMQTIKAGLEKEDERIEQKFDNEVDNLETITSNITEQLADLSRETETMKEGLEELQENIDSGSNSVITVVEKTVADGWNVRKWSDNTVELWSEKTISFVESSHTDLGNGLHSIGATITLPVNIGESPCCICSPVGMSTCWTTVSGSYTTLFVLLYGNEQAMSDAVSGKRIMIRIDGEINENN